MNLFNSHIDLVLATCSMSIGFIAPGLFQKGRGYILNSVSVLTAFGLLYLLFQLMNPIVLGYSFLFGVTVYKSSKAQISLLDFGKSQAFKKEARETRSEEYEPWQADEREEELKRRTEQVKRAREDQETKQQQESDKSEGKTNYRTVYDILGVDENCTLEELKLAKSRLASHFHPDKIQHLSKERQKEAEEDLKKVLFAYKTALEKFK